MNSVDLSPTDVALMGSALPEPVNGYKTPVNKGQGPSGLVSERPLWRKIKTFLKSNIGSSWKGLDRANG